MNLYKIIFTHYSPKDSESGIRSLVLAERDEQVYNWIVADSRTCGGWDDKDKYIYSEELSMFVDENGNEADEVWYDENGNPENFKARMLRLKGEVNDDSIELSDLYYGRTLDGWELVVENTKTDYSELITLGFIIKL